MEALKKPNRVEYDTLDDEGRGTRSLELILQGFPFSNSLDLEIGSMRGTMLMSAFVEFDPTTAQQFSREYQSAKLQQYTAIRFVPVRCYVQ